MEPKCERLHGNGETPLKLSYNPVESPTEPHKAEVEPGTVPTLQGDADTRLPADSMPLICEEFGLAHLKGNAVKELAKLGIAVESNGSIQVGTGAVLISQLALIELLLQLKDGVKDPVSALKYCHAIVETSKAVRAMADYSKTRVVTTAKAAPGPNRVESFDPDTPVRPNLTQINIHTHGKPPD